MSSQRIFDKLLELVVPALQSASTNSTGVQFAYGSVEDAVVEINVTAVTGTTPTFVPELQVTNDAGSTWKTVAKGQAITAIGRYELAFTGLGAIAFLTPSATPASNQVRFVSTLAGTTPNFTFGAYLTKD